MENQNAVVQSTSNSESNQIKKSSYMVYDYDEIIAALPAEKRQECRQLANDIDESDVNTIRTYGSNLNHRMDEANNVVLSHQTNNMGIEAFEMHKKLLKELKIIDVNDFQQDTTLKRIMRRIPVLKNFILTTQELFEQSQTVLSSVEKITDKLQGVKDTAEADNNMLVSVQENIRSYISELQKLIIGAKLRYEEFVDEFERLKESGSDTFELTHMKNVIDRLDKRIHSMIAQEKLLNMNLMQSEVIIKNNYDLADSMSEIVTNIIPLWKEQISQAIYVERQRLGFEMYRATRDCGNALVQSTSQTLHDIAIESAKQSEEQFFSIDTINKCAKDLIDMTEQLKRIKIEAKKQREQEKIEYQKIARELQSYALQQ